MQLIQLNILRLTNLERFSGGIIPGCGDWKPENFLGCFIWREHVNFFILYSPQQVLSILWIIEVSKYQFTFLRSEFLYDTEEQRRMNYHYVWLSNILGIDCRCLRQWKKKKPSFKTKTINNSKGLTHLPFPNSCEGNSLRHSNITWHHHLLIKASRTSKEDDSGSTKSKQENLHSCSHIYLSCKIFETQRMQVSFVNKREWEKKACILSCTIWTNVNDQKH